MILVGVMQICRTSVQLGNADRFLFQNNFSFSHWRYGPPDIACRIGNFSLQAMVHLYDNEFTRAERQGKFGTKVTSWIRFIEMIFSFSVLSSSGQIGIMVFFQCMARI